MAKQLGNLFFTITADATKFNAAMSQAGKQTEQFQNRQVKASSQVQTANKGMTLTFAAAAGAAAAFAFELIKTSSLASFAIGVISDTLESYLVQGLGMVWSAFDKAGAALGDFKAGLDKLGKGDLPGAFAAFGDMNEGMQDVLDTETQLIRYGLILGPLLKTIGVESQDPLSMLKGGFDDSLGAANALAQGLAAATRGEYAVASGKFEEMNGLLGGMQKEFGNIMAGGLLIGPILSGLGIDVAGFFEGLRTSAIDWATGTAAHVGQAMGMGWTAFTSWAGEQWKTLQWGGSLIWDSITNAWDGFTSWLGGAWNDFWAGASKTAGDIGDWVKGGLDWLGGLIPKFQAGGYVSQTGLAYLHAGETVVPAGSVDNSRTMNVPQITINVMSPQGLSFGGGVALGQDTRVAVTEAMRSVMNL